jgi:hypothetical protein
MFSYEVRGNNRVANKYRTAATRFPRRLDAITYQHVQRWRGDLKVKPYPPKRPGQTYVRTGKLANSWGVQKKGPASYKIINSAEYAKYVVSKVDQAWMHKNRWWTADEVVREQQRRQALTRDLTSELRGMLE